MSEYIANGSYCCALSSSKNDEISVDDRIVLVDKDGEIAETYAHFKEGETYVAKRFWFIRNSYRDLAHYETKKEAEKEYKRILAELSAHNTVVRV